MSTLGKDMLSDLSDWLYKQPHWLQHAALDILAGKSIGNEEIVAMAKLTLCEVAGTLAQPQTPPALDSLGNRSGGSVSLVSVESVTGVGQLKPRNPLKFGTEKIVVVFGSNGSGKSSYVRILKHACGARQKGEIHANVFDEETEPQSCTITFRADSGEQTFQWKAETGGIPELSTIDIFDTVCGHSYLAAEGAPTYEPRILRFLSQLAALCDNVAAKITSVIAAKVKALPALPNTYELTAAGKWYLGLTAQTQQAAVDENCAWGEVEDEELSGLAKYLAERSPKDRAKEFDTKKSFIDGITTLLAEHSAAFSDDSCKELMGLRKAAHEKQQTAELAAKVSLQSAVLEGVGTEQWLALWEIARTYSTEFAYAQQAFPNVGSDARCVLCHQELSTESKQRLNSFDDYVANDAATAAKSAKAALDAAIKALAALPDDETLNDKCTGAGLCQASIETLKGFYALLRARRALLIADALVKQFGNFPKTEEWVSAAKVISSEYAAQSKQFMEGFNEEDRKAKTALQNELLARKWIHEQKTAIEAEVKRLAQMDKLMKAKDLCSTRAISLKKSALSGELITPAYIGSFNSELKNLGARRVKVELVKTRVERGAVLHQVKLQNAVRSKPIQDVLSEGEHRIVCIAAFLADVSSKPNGSTFVFDDPISSLDLDYEEAVVQRLVSLSATRQVIVFTHRLSLLGMIQDYAKKAKVPVGQVQIRKELWGAGEPGNESIEAAKPKAVLNEHLPKCIAVAKAALEKEGAAAYRLHAQSICTETRKLIERMIELELLADVILRHRRAINTLGKLEKLADIRPEDCQLLEEMMTKYSRYEHAQSAEAPVELPLPDELAQDIATLKAWRDGLEARRK
jgi:energy-coupling factor transporter ATP-binding protein EcfA2